ncbi:unnamed protein product [Chondrus crispus]|uniref:Uncharacterized protein n=1 Tax=Chondrus crispus TaxID=2769 RepID=R7QBD3_CHOCR|nr:unnamed protein product [Chondrus crispus]CDF35374.1 unnamed protein product [Chondrus crispus]|eukprot:XP_005715193.1 unnamed protein product [Chondrus crispus]
MFAILHWCRHTLGTSCLIVCKGCRTRQKLPTSNMSTETRAQSLSKIHNPKWISALEALEAQTTGWHLYRFSPRAATCSFKCRVLEGSVNERVRVF